MSPTVAQLTAQEITGIGALLVVVAMLLNTGGKVLLSKIGIAKGFDLLDRQRLKDVHRYTDGVQTQIARGEFACAWEGRDEIRDFKDIMTRNAEATEALTFELKLTRNGKK